MTIIKPPYEQVLVGMGWIVGGPRETKEEKRKKEKVQETHVPGPEKSKENTQETSVSWAWWWCP